MSNNFHHSSTFRLFCVLVLIFCTILTVSTECPSDDVLSNDLYVIRSKGPNGLVLDATEPDQVRIQHFTGAESQLWKFVTADRPSSYHIVNEYQGKVLDFELRGDGNLHLIVSDKQKCMQQQWTFNTKGQIVNMANGKQLDIDKAAYVPGNIVIVWWDNGCPCQQFLLQKKT